MPIKAMVISSKHYSNFNIFSLMLQHPMLEVRVLPWPGGLENSDFSIKYGFSFFS